jgi:hypothetical protein
MERKGWIKCFVPCPVVVVVDYNKHMGGADHG